MKKIISKIKENKFIILVITTILITAIALTPKELQNDTFYSITIGQYIFNNGIDMMDHWSNYANLSYTYPHWAFDCLVYVFFFLGNIKGIYLLTIIMAFTLGITLYGVQNKLNNNKIMSLVCSIFVMCLLSSFITARAQMISYIFFVLEIYFIEMFLKTKKIKYVLGLFLSGVVIANCHAAVWPFMFVLLLPYLAEWFIHLLKTMKYPKILRRFGYYLKDAILSFSEKDKKVGTNKIVFSKNIKNYKWLIIVFIMLIFTGVCTPIGDTPFTYLGKTLKGTSMDYIIEHNPITLIESPKLLLTFIVIIMIPFITKIKLRLSDLFMIGGLCVVSLSANRQYALLAVIGIIIVGHWLSYLVNEKIPKITDLLESVAKKNIGILCCALLVAAPLSFVFLKNYNQSYINEKNYPVKATEFIQQELNVNQIKLFNDYNYGSFIMLKGIPVFIDSRADLYTKEFNPIMVEDYLVNYMTLDNNEYEAFFEKNDITHVLILKTSKLYSNINNDPNYKLLHKDDNFVLFERE